MNASQEPSRATRRRALVASLCAALGFFSCDGGSDTSPAPAPPNLSEPGANVLLLVVDTLRADVLTPYGGGADTSPTLSRMADAGVVFEQCRASSPWTLPSMGSILTGLYPRAHGAGLVGIERCVNRRPEGKYGAAAPIPEEGTKANRLADDVATIASTFANAGYDTYLRSTNPYYSYGLSDDFERAERGSATAEKVVDWGLAELRKRDASRPYFMTLHFIDVHTTKLSAKGMQQDMALFEREGRPPLGAELRNWALYTDEREEFEPLLDDRFRMYQACARYVDRQIGRLLKSIERMDTGPLYVVFTSDHGEEFRDHWDVDIASGHTDPRRNWEKVLGIGHGQNLHQALTHVPLVVTGPNLPAGLRVSETVGLVDILPTLADLTGVELLAQTDGRSLVPVLAGAPSERPAYISESLAYGREKTAFYTSDGYVLIQPRSGAERPQLFDLARDPTETTDLYSAETDRARSMLDALKRWESRLASRQGERSVDDAETLELLQDLGYAGDE